mgnify:CR=1 FL=1
MAVYEGAEEILVGSGNYCSAVTWIFNCDRWRIFNCSVYLYFVLITANNMNFADYQNPDSLHSPGNDFFENESVKEIENASQKRS